MWAYFRYALLLSLVESVMVSVALLWFGAGPTGSDTLRLFLLFVGAATLLRILINVPLVALSISGVAAWTDGANRLSIAGVNFAVYIALVVPLFLLSGEGAEVTRGFLLFGVACLVSPLIPWIEPPGQRTRKQEQGGTTTST
jgi:hypothetical protein